MVNPLQIKKGIFELLVAFDNELKRKGIKMDVLLFGSGAIIYYGVIPDRITRDVDLAALYPDFEVIEDFRIWLSSICKNYSLEKVDFDMIIDFPGLFIEDAFKTGEKVPGVSLGLFPFGFNTPQLCCGRLIF